MIKIILNTKIYINYLFLCNTFFIYNLDINMILYEYFVHIKCRYFYLHDQ